MKSGYHSSPALNACKGHCTDLFGVEAHPALTIKLSNKRNNEFRVKKIDKAITYIASILKVDWQIEEIIGALVSNVDFFQEHLLVIFVGYISDHDGGSCVGSIVNLVDVQGKAIGGPR